MGLAGWMVDVDSVQYIGQGLLTNLTFCGTVGADAWG